MSHTRGGFVSKCTAPFELILQVSASPSTDMCVVLKRQSNSLLSWSLAVNWLSNQVDQQSGSFSKDAS